MNIKRGFEFFLILIISLCLGALISAVSTGGVTPIGWLVSALLILASITLLWVVIHWAGDTKFLRWVTMLAFALRLVIGIGLTLALPVYGHENEQHMAGYLFYDAYERDSEAWHLASSGDSLSSAFQNQYISDQYGGLLSLSALIYRYLSPDMHRQTLMIILAALAGAIGIPFIWKALVSRWDQKAANWSTAILAFYPEAILLGSSHMREPYLLAFICIAIYALMSWKTSWKKSLLFLAICLGGLLAFSWRVAVVVAGVLAIWFWVEFVAPKLGRGKSILGWLVVALGIILMAGLSWAWFRETANYDAYLTEQASGSVQALVERIGEKYKIPLVTIYGLTQPVLPAALVATSKPLASAITIFRSLGWYLLAPLLLYGSYSSLKNSGERDKSLLVWLAGISLVWVVASSMRAGGDMWDNPRYRTIFLPFIALVIGWAIQQYTQKRDPWLMRIFTGEILVVLLFINWYLVRYRDFGIRIDFFDTVFLSIAALVIVLFLFPFLKKLKKSRNK